MISHRKNSKGSCDLLTASPAMNTRKLNMATILNMSMKFPLPAIAAIPSNRVASWSTLK